MTTEQAVRDYLISHGISQAFVARKCGWSRQKMCTILTGKQKIRSTDLEHVCKALGLPCDYFFKAVAAQDSA